MGGTIFLLLTPPPPDGQTRRGLDGAQAHPRHQHARSRRARESVHGECTLPRSPPPLFTRSHRRVTGRCLPLQVNRIKIPKQLDELVEMQNESANPVLKVLSKIKAELRGVRLCFFCYFSPFLSALISATNKLLAFLSFL